MTNKNKGPKRTLRAFTAARTTKARKALKGAKVLGKKK